jgi:hypothetical protein
VSARRDGDAPLAVGTRAVVTRPRAALRQRALLEPGLDLGEFAAELVERHLERRLLFDKVL